MKLGLGVEWRSISFDCRGYQRAQGLTGKVPSVFGMLATSQEGLNR